MPRLDVLHPVLLISTRAANDSAALGTESLAVQHSSPYAIFVAVLASVPRGYAAKICCVCRGSLHHVDFLRSREKRFLRVHGGAE